MEILQSIWRILTTENEWLTKILISPLVPLENLLYMLNFIALLRFDVSKKQKIIYVISISSLVLLNMYIVPMPYYTFLNILMCPILVFIIFKTSFLKSILSEIIIYITSLMFGTPLILTYTCILKIPSNLVSAVPIYRLTYSFIFFILLFLLYKYLCNHDLNISLFNKLRNGTGKKLVYNFVLGSIAIALQLFIEYKYIDYIPFYLIIFSLLTLFIYFFISLYSLIRTSKLEATAAKLEEEHLYNQTLGLLYDNIRGFKHDYNNIVQGIGGYIATNNIEGLKEYYSQILGDCQKVNNLSILSPQVINDPAIYSLITYKYHLATELGIKVNLEVFMDLSNISMKIYELTRILGVLIDNAIEAAKDSKEKEINIIIRKDNLANKQLFIVENTYLNKNVDLDKIFEKGHTSKANDDSRNHGLGLWEIRNIIKKKKDLDLFTTKNDKFFKQQFEIYCVKS